MEENGGRWALGLLSIRVLARVSVAAGIWGLCYAAYRGCYAAGGTALLPGTIRPGSEGQFQLINLAAVVVLAVAAVLPVAMLPLWARRGSRLVLLALCWVVAVGCCMHALIDMAQRVLSLAGLVHILFPDGLITGFPDAGAHNVAWRGSPGLRRLRTSSMLLITLLTAL